MQKRTGRRRRDHSAQQPGVERHLRRFGHARKAQARKREYHERRRERADDDEVEEIDGVEFEHHEEERSQKGDAADHVHDDLTERIRDRFLSAGVADEEEGANCGDLPTGIEPDEIVAEDDRIHRCKEDEHEREEARTTIRFMLMFGLEVFHVANGVDANACAHKADDERHDERERINIKTAGAYDIVRASELEDERADKLDGRKAQHPEPSILDTVEDNDCADDHADSY